MNEGWSAEQKARELAAAGEGPAAAAWAAGAEGERRVATHLASLGDGWTVLHDRLLRPGLSEANLDHVVVGPGGLFLVDAKNWSGNVTAFDGGLYQHLGAGAARASHSRHTEVAKVHGMAAYMAAETGMPVTSVICLAGPNQQGFGEPQMIRGVWVIPASKLVTWLESREYVLDRDARAKAVTRVMATFPSTTTDPELLAAMGGVGPRAGRPSPIKTNRTSPSARRRGGGGRSGSGPRRSRSPLEKLARSLVGLGFALVSFWVLINYLPPLLTAGVERMVTPPAGAPGPGQSRPTEAAPPVATKAAKPKITAASPPKATAKAVKTAAPKPPRPVACGNASRAEVSKIVGRAVHPVAVRTGCAWGTRLDDPSTTLVSIVVSESHRPYDFELETSRTQRRVVFGSRYDSNYRDASFL